MGVRLSAWVLLLLASLPARAETDPCKQFHAYMNAGVQQGVRGTEWEQALKQFDRALKFTCSAEDDVTLQLYRGIVLFNMRRTGPAREAFRQALLLNRDAQLPGTFGRKLRGFLEEVRAELPPEPEKPPAPPKPPPPAVEVAAVTPAAPEPTPLAVTPTPSAEVKRPADSPVAADLSPRDPAPTLVVPLEKQERPSTVRTAAFILGGAAVASAGAATYFGLQSRFQADLARQSPYMDDMRRNLDQAGTSALVANVLFGMAGTLAAGSLVALFASIPGEQP